MVAGRGGEVEGRGGTDGGLLTTACYSTQTVDIEANLRTYLEARQPLTRYTSFDYCFNYFQEYRERDDLPGLLREDAVQLSCLHLGFYLASWGMFRGSAEVLQHSVRTFVPVVEVIANAPPEIWEIDADGYGDGSCPLVFEAAERLRAVLPGTASDILVTKIMLGTFGCVPAFDSRFKRGFGASTFGSKALREIGTFYRENAEVIERNRVETLDFASGKPTRRHYTRAKVIDMVFFVEGGS